MSQIDASESPAPPNAALRATITVKLSSTPALANAFVKHDSQAIGGVGGVVV